MSRLTISKDQRHLCRDGIPFFWLADTIWSAFTNITLDDWSYYLKKRKNQGFNVLQINTLAQWDRGESSLNRSPFKINENGMPDYEKTDQTYFDNAREMCRMAKQEGFELALVILWCNQVPGTWANQFVPKYTIGKEVLPGIINKILDSFDEFEPIYIVGGDTDFPKKETIAYYKTVFDILAERHFQGLKTIHIKGRFTDIPDEIAQMVDFYLYQSGHNVEAQQMAYTSAEILYNREPKRPVINSEPCYEQMGYSHNLYGRFGQFEIRRAAWQGILSGACAGVTYGAHGVWNWVSSGYKSTLALGEGFDAPFPHQQALEFPGAWDYGFIREFFTVFSLNTMIPCREIILNKSEEIRAARNDRGVIVVYLPVNTKLQISGDYSQHRIRAYDLLSRSSAWLYSEKKADSMIIDMHPFSKDALIVIDTVKMDDSIETKEI